MTHLCTVVIIRTMKNLIIACLLIISVLTAGCGGGGGSSSTPAGNVVTPTIVEVKTESTTTATVATITGSGFGLESASSHVKYNGVKYPHTFWSDTLITVTVPQAGADSLGFRVVVGNITSNMPVNTGNNMKIYSINPSSGNPGTVVTISGSGFGTSQVSGAYVTFYDLAQPTNYSIAAASNWSDSSITCTVPTNLTLSQSNSSQVGVTVWKSSTLYVSGTFNLILPQISYIDPTSDNVGATISINGSGFGNVQGSSYVRIGGNYTTVVSWADSLIRARVPDFAAAGQKTIEITINNRVISNNSFNFAMPRVDQTYATANPVSYGSTFSITGNYFGVNDDFSGTGGTTRSVVISGDGVYAVVSNFTTWNDQMISFSWPVSNTAFTKTVSVTLKIGDNFSHTTTNITAD